MGFSMISSNALEMYLKATPIDPKDFHIYLCVYNYRSQKFEGNTGGLGGEGGGNDVNTAPPCVKLSTGEKVKYSECGRGFEGHHLKWVTIDDLSKEGI